MNRSAQQNGAGVGASRSRLAPRAIIIIVVLMLGGGLVLLLPSSSPQTATAQSANDLVIRELQQRSRELHARRLAELDRAQFTGVGEFHEYLIWLDRAAEQMHGPDAAMLQIGGALLRQMHREVAVYETAADRLFALGGIDPTTFKTEADVEQRQLLVGAVREASAAIAAQTRSLPGRLSNELAAAGFEPGAVETAVAGIRRGGNFDLILQVHQHEQAICDEMLSILELLHREWGRWSVDPHGLVEFDRPDAAMVYAQLQKSVNEAATQQEEVQRLLLMRRPLNGG